MLSRIVTDLARAVANALLVGGVLVLLVAGGVAIKLWGADHDGWRHRRIRDRSRFRRRHVGNG